MSTVIRSRPQVIPPIPRGISVSLHGAERTWRRPMSALTTLHSHPLNNIGDIHEGSWYRRGWIRNQGCACGYRNRSDAHRAASHQDPGEGGTSACSRGGG